MSIDTKEQFTQEDIDKAWKWLPAYIILGIVAEPFRWLLSWRR